MPIEATNGLSALCAANVAPAGMLWPSSASRSRVGFSSNAGDLPGAVESEDAHLGGVVNRDGLCGDRDVGAAIDMGIDEVAVVHPVEMVARENQVVVRVVPLDLARGLPDGVGGALKPVGVVGRLFGRQDLDEPVAEEIHAVGLRDVAVERRRVELRQDEDAPDVRVEAVADGDVDEPVLSANRHGGLGPQLGERKQPAALTAAEDQREDFVVGGHDARQMVHRRAALAACNRRVTSM